MTARVIDGRARAAMLKEEVAREAAALRAAGTAPGLAVILVGDDAASQVYVRNKIATCNAVGIESFGHFLRATTSAPELLALIAQLNADPAVHGILLQLPLPPHLDPNTMLQAIDPAKDVDGLHPLNAGRLMAGLPGPVPCTPQGALLLIRSEMPDLTGLNAVVVGRSLLFGKPMAQLLLAENCDRHPAAIPASVDLADHLPPKPTSWSPPSAARGHGQRRLDQAGRNVVIDVGINRLPGGKAGGRY